MAHTIEDLVINVADKYSSDGETYRKNKKMLWELVDELHHPTYIEKLIEQNYKEL
jgi:hypothetical protein